MCTADTNFGTNESRKWLDALGGITQVVVLGDRLVGVADEQAEDREG